jgi:hypothetical protein
VRYIIGRRRKGLPWHVVIYMVAKVLCIGEARCRRLQHQSVEVGGCRGKLRFVAVRMEQIEGPISTVIHRTASKAAVISLEPGPYVSDT